MSADPRDVRHDKYVEMAREFYAKRSAGYDQAMEKRERLVTKNEARQEQLRRYYNDKKIRDANRLKRIEADRQSAGFYRNLKRGILLFVLIGILVVMIEIVIPGSKMKKRGVIDDTPISERVYGKEEKKDAEELSEEQILWKLLTEHFGGNKTAVLGVMCNLKAESRFEAGNLEDYNNELWDIDDHSYTEGVNRRTIDKKDFLESRNQNDTNGYYNDYDQWVNTDGGYGYAQYTAYENKEALYQYAEHWFGPGGEGEGEPFDIGDPNMQAHYIVELLTTDQYSDMDARIRSAESVVDACYIWLKYYEKPYDPYSDDYYTLAFDRAAFADEIEQSVRDGGQKENTENTESTTEEW